MVQLYTFHVGILGRHDGPHINIPQIILALEKNQWYANVGLTSIYLIKWK